MKLFLTVCSIIVAASSASEFYFSQAPDSIPGNFTVWKYDTSLEKTTKISEGYESYDNAYDFVSGAAICGNNYYASAVQAMIAWGLLVTDVTTGKSTVFDAKRWFGNRLLHNMWCDPKDPTGKSFYSVQNAPNDPNDNDFYLYHVTVNGDNVENRQIAVFPYDGYWTGSDAMFQATEDVKEVWVGWSNKNQNGGLIQVMDVSTGKATDYQLSGVEEGLPYTLFPLKSGQNSALGVLCNHQQHKDAYVAQMTLEGGSTKVTNDKVASYAYVGAEPWAMEYAKSLAHGVVSNTSGPDRGTIQTMDAKTGQLVSTLKMADVFNDKTGTKVYKVGALAVKQ